jgi:hypothetical protein
MLKGIAIVIDEMVVIVGVAEETIFLSKNKR